MIREHFGRRLTARWARTIPQDEPREFVSLATAILTGVLASAGATTASAIIGSKAAHDASNAQVAQSNNALALQQQIWQQQQQNMAPWLQTGGAAENKLGQLLGLGGGAAHTGGPPTVPITGANTGVNAPTVLDTRATLANAGNGAWNPLETMLSGPAKPGALSPDQMPMASGANVNAAPRVRMMSPDGTETQDVPASQVDFYVARGARVLNSPTAGAFA